MDVSIEETNEITILFKLNKSPGEDGIISAFYSTHWQQTKDEIFLLLTETFDKEELTPL